MTFYISPHDGDENKIESFRVEVERQHFSDEMGARVFLNKWAKFCPLNINAD